MKYLALAALLVVGVAQAGEAKLTCTAPTQNTDGSALVNLAGFLFHYGTSAAALTQVLQVPNPATCAATIANLTPGTWYFGVKAYTTAGAESALSNVASKVIAEPVPNPPGSLAVVDQVAYQVIGTLDKFVLLPVGSVPADTPCNPSQNVNGHYGVPRAAVTWYGSVKPQSVVAKCSG